MQNSHVKVDLLKVKYSTPKVDSLELLIWYVTLYSEPLTILFK